MENYKKGDIIVLPNKELNIVEAYQPGTIMVLRLGYGFYLDCYYEDSIRHAIDEEKSKFEKRVAY